MSFLIITLWWAVLGIAQYIKSGEIAACVFSIIFIGVTSIIWVKHCRNFELLKRKVEELELNQPPKEVKK